MTAQHTPGPWKPACKSNGATCRHPAILCDEGQVGNATWQGSESATDANARLIAAAPDMLKALQKIAKGWWVTMDEHEMRDIAVAAIAKATGHET